MLIREFTLYPVDILNLPVHSYTNISANITATTSWTDHFICSKSQVITNIEILYGSTFSDHFPIASDIHFPIKVVVGALNHKSNDVITNNIVWLTLSGQ